MGERYVVKVTGTDPVLGPVALYSTWVEGEMNAHRQHARVFDEFMPGDNPFGTPKAAAQAHAQQISLPNIKAKVVRLRRKAGGSA